MGSDGKTRAARKRAGGSRRVVLELVVYARRGVSDECVCDAVIDALDRSLSYTGGPITDSLTPSVIADKTEKEV